MNTSSIAPTFEKMLTKLGIEYLPVGRRLQLCCKFHDDNNPSAAIYDDSDQETYFCWTCNLTLNPIQFYQKYKDISWAQSREIVESDFSYVPRKAKYDNVIVLRECGVLNATLHANLQGMSRTFACKIGELIDKLEWSVRNGTLTQEKFVTASVNLKGRIENAPNST